jgi:hypothetical protein
MATELDHVFVCTAPGAPEAEQLIRLGLTEGSPNRHPGQGTANRRFFFENAFLELVWVTDPAEAQSDLVRRTGLWERWSRRGRGASPFGVGLRPAPGEGNAMPFPAWEYRPPYLPEPLAIHMANNSDTPAAPLLFYLAFGRRPDPTDPARQQPRQHAAGFRSMTRVRVHCASGDPAALPEVLEAERHCAGLSFVPGSEDLMELGFDGELRGRAVDLRPALPLVLRG